MKKYILKSSLLFASLMVAGGAMAQNTNSGYFVDESEADAFDKAFPPKKKEKLPGQLF